MDTLSNILIFLAWSLGAGACVWLIVHGAKMVKSSQESEFSLIANTDEIQFNGNFKAGLVLTLTGVVALVFLIYSYWKIVYAMAVVAVILSTKINQDKTAGNKENENIEE